jgi:hypothetical protein
MLRRFLYLDTPALIDYVSALEDGLRESKTLGDTAESNLAGGLGIPKVANIAAESSTSGSSSVLATDTAAARFDRLLQLAQESPERSGWLDLASFDEFSQAGYGALVDFECEIHVPDQLRVLASAGAELDGLAQIMNSMGPLAKLIGDTDMSDLPSADEIGAMTGFLGALKAEPAIIGESDESEWRVLGKLKPDFLKVGLGDLDDYVRITAKVGKPIPRGKWQPLLALPGMSMLSRDERRALEKSGPDAGDEGMFIQGPARILDILAVYR